MEHTYFYNSPLGTLCITSDGEVLIGIDFIETNTTEDVIAKHRIQGTKTSSKDIPIFQETITWLDTYFAGQNPGPIPPVKLSGTEFQVQVQNIIKDIPYGHVMTYGEIAKRVATLRGKERMSAQAVGNAVGKNPIPIIIPCHRVMGANDKLTGFSCGIDKKIALLNIENIPWRY